jgi:hypothetical protein
MPFTFAFCSIDRCRGHKRANVTALGAVTLALLTTFVGRVYCGENFMNENYGEVRSADNSRRNHACANRISRRTVCTGI